jgi:hypothetical protein
VANAITPFARVCSYEPGQTNDLLCGYTKLALGNGELVQAFPGQFDVGLFCQCRSIAKGRQVILFPVVVHTAQVQVNFDILSWLACKASSRNASAASS